MLILTLLNSKLFTEGTYIYAYVFRPLSAGFYLCRLLSLQASLSVCDTFRSLDKASVVTVYLSRMQANL